MPTPHGDVFRPVSLTHHRVSRDPFLHFPSVGNGQVPLDAASTQLLGLCSDCRSLEDHAAALARGMQRCAFPALANRWADRSPRLLAIPLARTAVTFVLLAWVELLLEI